MTGTTTGIVAIGEGGQIQFKAGLGQVSEIESLVLEIHKQAYRAAQRLHAIPSEKLIVLVVPMDHGKLYLLHDAHDEETLLEFISAVDFGYDILNQLVSSLAVVDAEAK